jgi:hypothetical protein
VVGLFLVRLFTAGRERREHQKWHGLQPPRPRPPGAAPARRDPWGW